MVCCHRWVLHILPFSCSYDYIAGIINTAGIRLDSWVRGRWGVLKSIWSRRLVDRKWCGECTGGDLARRKCVDTPTWPRGDELGGGGELSRRWGDEGACQPYAGTLYSATACRTMPRAKSHPLKCSVQWWSVTKCYARFTWENIH